MPFNPIAPPASEQALMSRARALSGKTIGEVAAQLNFEVPETLKRKKGWQGQFLEACLGADSGNLSQPDFAHLGIELKTLPIDFNGKVQESTYVCVLNLTGQSLLKWEESPVCHKLNKVLWVPVARSKDTAVMQSRIATPFLWQLDPETNAILKSDWENAVELVNLGRIDELNARLGEYLQVRPKAANSRVLTKSSNRSGESIETLPRGFYLRAGFTQGLLNRHLKLD